MLSHVERFFVDGLAHASYLIIHGSEAAVVDPKRDVDDYLQFATQRGARIKAVLNTHPHADFASGFMELAEKTGATIYTSHLAPVQYPHHAARDQDLVSLDGAHIRILETPGHSPDSLSFVLEEGAPVALFTGDLLFVGDVGRPDLRDADADPTSLAGQLYDSLFQKVLQLPETVRVYPAHGAGSLCGRAIASAEFSTVAAERENNWALQLTDRETFVREMISNLPDRPAYFAYDVGVNLKGAPPWKRLPEIPQSDADAIVRAQAQGASILDLRPASQFGQGHLKGSLNIGLESPLFSTWTGFFISGAKPIYLIAQDLKEISRARLELARIGFDQIDGYLLAEHLPDRLYQTTQVTACDLRDRLNTKTVDQLMDVRTCGERKVSHIESSMHIPLPRLLSNLQTLDPTLPTVVYCGSGYRSAIAASLLEASGFSQITNLMGGMHAWENHPCDGLNPAELVFPTEA